AVLLQRGGSFPNQVLKHRAEVGQVEEEELRVVAVLEDHRERALLGVVQPQGAREEERTERGHGGAHRNASRSTQAQELDRRRRGREGRSDLLGALEHARIGLTWRGEAAQIALQIREEDRDARRAQLFGESL